MPGCLDANSLGAAMEAALQQRIRDAAARLREHGATAVYLFGSSVRGPLRDDSDIDLAVTGLPARVFFKAVAEASRIVGRSVDVVELDRGGEVAEALRRFEGLELVL